MIQIKQDLEGVRGVTG